MLAHPSLENTFGHGLLLSLVFSIKKKPLHAAVHVFFFYLPTCSPILSIQYIGLLITVSDDFLILSL